ncbi:MAG TPA: hypothetical protein VFB38_26470 [Chthonomonadaceae bacterium]|nr:hypothetical protein [Chthonomonadaceae bacterium]
MTLSHIASKYDSFSQENLILFLTCLIHELTITMRGYYSATPQVVNSDIGSRVGILNEIEHRVAGFLRDIVIGVPERATGESLLDTIFGWAKHAHLEQEMAWALESALSKVDQLSPLLKLAWT